ncbi:hypothetical protein [Paraburkholderia caribensis]|uniref:hypothetical protein n=1 Tax=Paraburkholderia caribensis TaxID=75105 RepID=UPI001D05FB95|nr:hypothetical protein [Paraburkholderia caribensis]
MPSSAETALDIPPDTPVDQIVETGPTFLVRTIALADSKGNPLSGPLPQSTLAAIVAPFAGHQGSHRVNALLKRLTDA